MADSDRIASSSTSGFFQPLPVVPPQFTSPYLADEASQAEPAPKTRAQSDDVVLSRVLGLYLSPAGLEPVSEAIHNLSRRVLLPSTLQHSVDAELNLPTLHLTDTFGQRNDNQPLRTSEGWKALKRIAVEEGIVSRAYDEQIMGWNRRIEQFGLVHVWAATSAMTMCPMSMTDGAASLLSRHLQDPDGDQPGRGYAVGEAYRRLVSSDPATLWTCGQWMTERTGGSDVSRTETLARRLTDGEVVAEGAAQDSVGIPLGPWRLDGFKWFSSATDSDMAMLLARTSKGLSLFFIPLRQRTTRSSSLEHESTELNGIRLQKLKDKLGTRGLPTAELEIHGARGWLIGEEGKGVKEISTLFNITRIHTAAGSAAFWARSLAISRAFSKIRETRGQFLYKNLQHSSWMAGETVKYCAAAHFAMFGPAFLGCNEQGWEQTAKNTPARDLIPQDRLTREILVRLLTPVMKAQVSVAAVNGVRACMEGLGGVGYCENNEDGGILNIAKLFRDSMVNVIWEGTVSVMAEDVGRVLSDKRIGNGDVIGNVFAPWVRNVLSYCKGHFGQECMVVQERLKELQVMLDNISGPELQWRGREVLDHLEAIMASVFLMFDACRDKEKIACHVASRWVWSKALPTSKYRQEPRDWKLEAAMDQKIFVGLSPKKDGKL
ncbi:hypothetical protein ACHAPT_008462 [Fusarium lateritium]